MKIGNNLLLDGSGVNFVDKDGNRLEFSTAIKKITVRFSNWLLDAQLYILHAVSEHIPIWTLRKLLFVLSGVKIGKGSTIHMGVRFFDPGGIVIGKDTIIGNSTFLDGRADLRIGDHVDIASEVMIYNSEHDINSRAFKAVEEKVIINDYVFIGPRAIILPGVTIGKGAVVGAGAVVTKDVGDFKIVGGIPAKTLGERTDQDPNYRLGRARLFQ